MLSLRERQARFAAGLLDPDLAAPDDLVAWNGPAGGRRFAVYRNNVAVGLIEALRRRFPVCARLVGEEFFGAMAGLFARLSPPRSPLLMHYGEGFASFVEGFEPARPVPYLADEARLEFAFGLAYHAPDADPLAADRIEAIPQERWGDLVFTLHPSLQLVASPWPIVSVWATNTHDAEVVSVDLSAAEDALVARPALEVEVRRLAPGGHAFLAALATGLPLAAAAKAGAAASPSFDLCANLYGLIAAGLAVDFSLAPHPQWARPS